MRDILLAGGCSYTDPNYRSLDQSLPDSLKGGWPMWPDYVGSHLNLKIINTAESGADNLTTHNRIIRNLLTYGKNIKLVCVLWSEFDRFKFMHVKSVQLLDHLFRSEGKGDRIHPVKNMITDTKFYDWLKTYTTSEYWDPKRIMVSAIIDTFTYMTSIALLCKSMGIPYIFYQGIRPLNFNWMDGMKNIFPRDIKTDILSETIKSNIFRQLENYKSNIIGYPFFKELGGSCFDDESFRIKGDFNVSKFDYHPNAPGQKIISKIILERYNKLYA